MERLLLNDFSAGWVSDDDPANGRKNGLLKMDSVTLEQNGILAMSGGTSRVTTAYSANAHTIWTKYLAGSRYFYVALTTGDLLVNNTVLLIGTGSTVRAAFGAYSNKILFLSGNQRYRGSGISYVTLGRVKPTVGPVLATGGAGTLTGSYEYCQINVYADGNSWIGKSPRSAITTYSPSSEYVQITGQAPTTADADANETWFFRRGGLLDQFYRIARLTSAYTTPFNDTMSDIDALSLGITLNEYLATIASSGDITEEIYECVGPIYGRMVYFTPKRIIPSEINSPDTYDIRTVFSYFGGTSGAEIFLWAKKVADNTILVGTTSDVYILSGQWIQNPDGFLDVYLRPLSTQYPPISQYAEQYESGAIYMSKIGPVHITYGGSVTPLVGLNTALGYKGQTRQGYTGISIGVPLSTYIFGVRNSELWVGTPLIGGSFRIEILDLKRKTWRALTSGFTTISKMATGEDGQLYGFDTNDKYIKILDYQTARTLDDGSSTKQTIAVRTLFQDQGEPHRLKTPYAVKIKGQTGGDTLTIKTAIDNSSTYNTLGTFSSSSIGEKIFDISSLGDLKNISLDLSGTLADFVLNDLEILWDVHPVTTLFQHFDFTDFNLVSPNKKRIRVLAFVINTHGQNVTFTPIIDGVAGTTSTVNTSYKAVHFHYFTTDIFAVNISGKLQAATSTGFEFWNALKPEIYQVLPTGRKFDQIGPHEFFRWGKISRLDFRLIAFGGTTIPYQLYIDDAVVTNGSGNITVVDGKESSYEIGITKYAQGKILRVELGPTSFPFHRMYTRACVARSGADQDEKWEVLENA